jgi:flavin-dependent dehydrogenase
MKPFDVIIIGAGLAGAAAGIELARAGKKVLLLEKEAQAHHKVCGEFISCEAKYYLAKLGLDLEKLGAKEIKYIRLTCGNKSTEALLPFSAFSLSRFALDENLLELAIASGVEVRRQANVTALTQLDKVWNVRWSNDNSACANSIFLASGKHNLKGWARAPGVQNDLIGFKMHFKPSAAQREKISKYVEIILFDGGYAGLEPVEGKLVNLCLVVKKSRFTKCEKDWTKLLKYIAESSPHFAEFLQSAVASWPQPLAIFGIPYGFIHQDIFAEPEGLYRLGDQMAVIPSFCGDGMAIALHSAFVAVQNYLHKNSKSYYQEIRSQLSGQIKQASRIAKLISPRINQKIIYSICARFPKLLSVIAGRTRLKFFYRKIFNPTNTAPKATNLLTKRQNEK